MAKVFVVNDSGHDFSAAQERGELIYLSQGKVNVFATDRLLKEISDRLKDSSPDDFIIPSGNNIASCLAVSHFMQKHGLVNLLIYSFKNDAYEVRTVRSGLHLPKEAQRA